MIIFIGLSILLVIIILGIIFYFCYLFYCWRKQQNINTHLFPYYSSSIIKAIPIENWRQIKAIIASEYTLNKERFQLEEHYGISGDILTVRIKPNIIYLLYFVHFFDYVKMICWYAKLERNKETVEQKRKYAKMREDQKEFYQLVASIGQENVDELNNIINNNLNTINDNLAAIKASLK